MRRPTRLSVALATALGLAVTLGGCGDADPAAHDGKAAATSPARPAASPAEAGSASGAAKPLPRCGEVWKSGQRLPHGYHGCRHGDRTVRPHGEGCSSGQHLETYGRHFYAVRGGVVQRVADLRHSADYRQVRRACSG